MTPPRLVLLALLLCLAWVRAEEEQEPAGPDGSAEPSGPGGAQLLMELAAANKAKDFEKYGLLVKQISDYAPSAKDEAEIDGLAVELVSTLKIARKEHALRLKVVDAMGLLRSKKGAGSLAKIAFKKKARDEKEEELQAHAILALSQMRDPKHVRRIGDMTKHKSTMVARAAYEGFVHYGPAKGKVRKEIAELLMKRLDAEYPTANQDGNVSGAQKVRWNALSPVIVKTMQSVCRENTIVDIENWREWWGENKRSRTVWKDKKPEDS